MERIDKKDIKHVYIAGPMRNRAFFNKRMFDIGEREIKMHVGFREWHIINPITSDKQFGVDHSKYPDGDFERLIKEHPSIGSVREILTRAAMLVAKCNAIVLLPDFEYSIGARMEAHVAMACGLECWLLTKNSNPDGPLYTLREVTHEQLRERLYSQQPEAIRAQLVDDGMDCGMSERIKKTGNQIIDLLIQKNADYGNSSMRAPVLVPKAKPSDAILVRLSDKIMRLRNLFGGHEARVAESVVDTVRDMAGYCVLWLCYTEAEQGSAKERKDLERE